METTALEFAITLGNIARSAESLGLLDANKTLVYSHNGAGHAPYVFVKDSDGATDHAATRAAADFLPLFSYKFTRRESMAALVATERALQACQRQARGA